MRLVALAGCGPRAWLLCGVAWLEAGGVHWRCATPQAPWWRCNSRRAFGDGGAGGDGGLSGRPASEQGLKGALRQLYLRVHPDLFADSVTARAENERSFKLLQEYLQQARSGDPRSPAARAAYHFAFYVREVVAHADGDKADGTAAAAREATTSRSSPEVGTAGGSGSGGLKRVAVSLPPPQRHSEASPRLSGTSRKALRKLLAAVGLEHAWPRRGEGSSGDGGGDAGETAGDARGYDSDDEAGALSLSAFLPDAAEQLRQNEAARADPSVRAAQIRGALRLGRQLLVSFPPHGAALKADTQVELLRRLAALLDAAPWLRVAGCRVMLGVDGPSHVDRLGQLCLSVHEGDAEWRALLTGVDLPFVLGRQEYAESVRRLQQATATAAGLQAVFAPAQHMAEPTYREFLERLASAAQERGPAGGGRFSGAGGMCLCVLPSHARHTESSCPSGVPLGTAGYALDEATGVLHLVDDLSAAEVYELVATFGDAALAAARVRAARQAVIDERLSRVQRVLRLRRISKEPLLSVRHLDEACRRLLERAEDLRYVVEGSSLRIGFANRLSQDGLCIEVAYNFED